MNDQREKMEFKEFYQQNYPKAVLYTSKKIGNYSDAEDLVCDVFAYCYEHYAHYDPGKASESTWLYVILNSRIKNYYRDRKELIDLSQMKGLSSETDYIQEACELGEMREMLAKALEMLSERARQVVIMRYFYGYSTAETAKRLGLTESNARVILTRAIKEMKKYCDLSGCGKD